MGSTVTLAKAAEVEPTYLPAGWEIKVATAPLADPAVPAPGNPLLASDESTGKVTAIVGVTGIVDHVADLIEPGAYTKTLRKRRPKICWAHDWEKPIGKVLAIEEWAPGDSRLAEVGATLAGQPWPADAGALVVTAQFNMKSDRGREAFAAVEFYSESNECEWSIGWQTIPSKTIKRKDGVRVCKEVELFEVSPVLFGAAPLTRTLEVKSLDLASAMRDALQVKVGEPAGEPADDEADQLDAGSDAGDQLHAAALEEIDWAEVEGAIAGGEPGSGEVKAFRAFGHTFGATPGEWIAGQHPRDAKGRFIEARGFAKIEGSKRTVFIPSVGSVPNPNGVMVQDEDTLERFYVHPSRIEMIKLDEDARKKRANDLFAYSDYRAGGGDYDGLAPAGTLSRSEWEAERAKQHAELATPAPRRDYDPVDTDPDQDNGGQRVPLTEEDLAAWALPDTGIDADNGGRRAPLTDEELRRLGGKAGEPEDLERKGAPAGFVALDLSAFDRAVDGIIDFDALPDVVEAKAGEGGADRNSGNAEELRRWYEEGDGAAQIKWGTDGDFMRCVRIAGKHMTPERAKGYCNLRHHGALGVYAGQEKSLGVQAAETLAKTWNPLLEVGADAAHTERKHFGEGGLRGTFEERTEKLRDALHAALAPVEDTVTESGQPSPTAEFYINVEGTWDDRVVATHVRFGNGMGPSERTTYEVPYSWDGQNIALGAPRPVELQVTVVPTGDEVDPLELDDAADLVVLPALADLDAGVEAMKSAFAHSPEVKAGRVMSEANITRFRAALEHLMEVARAAGIELTGWTGNDSRLADNEQTPDTTARPAGAAPETATKSLSQDDLAAELAQLGDFGF